MQKLSLHILGLLKAIFIGTSILGMITIIFISYEHMEKSPDFYNYRDPGINFSDYKNYKKRKEIFIGYLRDKIDKKNTKTLLQRGQLERIYKQYIETNNLSEQQISWLISTAHQYRIKHLPPDEKLWEELFLRVDAIPPSLALAQAALETAWGTSRFAKEGNNYFGIWCFNKGCGIVPLQRDGDKSHEVKRFSDVQESVNKYIYTLNTHPRYAELRAMRAGKRAMGKYINGFELASGLLAYSTMREEYISRVRSIILQNRLEKYDNIGYNTKNNS